MILDDETIFHALILIVILCFIGGAIALLGGFNTPSNHISANEITHNFNYGEADVIWDNNLKELKHTQKITVNNFKDYKDIDFKVDFYKDDKLIGTKHVYVDKTVNGTCNLDFTIKLTENPTEIFYEIVEATEA
ncbi:MAG: hypothetical protein MJ224_08065 [archaeon]|nr:hypothetical protein [archaeon]